MGLSIKEQMVERDRVRSMLSLSMRRLMSQDHGSSTEQSAAGQGSEWTKAVRIQRLIDEDQIEFSGYGAGVISYRSNHGASMARIDEVLGAA